MTKPVWSHVLALSALKKISDCIRYIIGVLWYKFKSQRDIAHAKEFTILISFAESLRQSNVYIFYL